MKPQNFSNDPVGDTKDHFKSESKLNSEEKDSFWANCPIFSGPCPEDISTNHDKYLYGRFKK